MHQPTNYDSISNNKPFKYWTHPETLHVYNRKTPNLLFFEPTGMPIKSTISHARLPALNSLHPLLIFSLSRISTCRTCAAMLAQDAQVLAGGPGGDVRRPVPQFGARRLREEKVQGEGRYFPGNFLRESATFVFTHKHRPNTVLVSYIYTSYMYTPE